MKTASVVWNRFSLNFCSRSCIASHWAFALNLSGYYFECSCILFYHQFPSLHSSKCNNIESKSCRSSTRTRRSASKRTTASSNWQNKSVNMNLVKDNCKSFVDYEHHSRNLVGCALNALALSCCHIQAAAFIYTDAICSDSARQYLYQFWKKKETTSVQILWQVL